MKIRRLLLLRLPRFVEVTARGGTTPPPWKIIVALRKTREFSLGRRVNRFLPCVPGDGEINPQGGIDAVKGQRE